MKMSRTLDKAEAIFFEFCIGNDLDVLVVPEGDAPSVDFEVNFSGYKIAFEIKTITEIDGWSESGVSGRVVGKKVGSKLRDASKQMQFLRKNKVPAVVLIYNSVDPMQLFGTEPHDFICSMYGNFQINVGSAGSRKTTFGRSSMFSRTKNTSFSAIGSLSDCMGFTSVRLFENTHAAVPIEYSRLPSCIDVVKVRG